MLLEFLEDEGAAEMRTAAEQIRLSLVSRRAEAMEMLQTAAEPLLEAGMTPVGHAYVNVDMSGNSVQVLAVALLRTTTGATRTLRVSA